MELETYPTMQLFTDVQPSSVPNNKCSGFVQRLVKYALLSICLLMVIIVSAGKTIVVLSCEVSLRLRALEVQRNKGSLTVISVSSLDASSSTRLSQLTSCWDLTCLELP